MIVAWMRFGIEWLRGLEFRVTAVLPERYDGSVEPVEVGESGLI